jgi:hypothetical protein
MFLNLTDNSVLFSLEIPMALERSDVEKSPIWPAWA